VAGDALVRAAAEGDAVGVAAGLRRGVDVCVVHSMSGYTALHAAADFGRTAMVEALLDIGASPDARDRRLGRTPLHFAAHANHAEDGGTVDYLRDCAHQAGIETHRIDVEAIGLGDDGCTFFLNPFLGQRPRLQDAYAALGNGFK
jgi:pimeloyl-ACP methyl ester carboxylesterase